MIAICYQFPTWKLEPVSICLLFVLEHGRLEELVSVGVAEMRERDLVFAHEVHDVSQRLYGRLVALQHHYDDAAQLFNDTEMVRGGHGEVSEHRHHLAPEHGQLLGRDKLLGEALLNVDRLGAQTQVVRPSGRKTMCPSSAICSLSYNGNSVRYGNSLPNASTSSAITRFSSSCGIISL